jgi:hypothetical protein
VTRYHDVLGSQRWRDLKWRAIMRAEFRCEHCGRRYIGPTVRGAMKHFNLHHRHYRSVGSEEFADVLVLCRTCHRLQHDLLAEAR